MKKYANLSIEEDVALGALQCVDCPYCGKNQPNCAVGHEFKYRYDHTCTDCGGEMIVDWSAMHPRYDGTHLWDHSHPYYCEESGYYYNISAIDGWGAPLEYNSWTDFINDGWHKADHDMNFLFRWDWYMYTKEQFAENYGMEHLEDTLRDEPNAFEPHGYMGELKLFLMMQRKGCKKVITIKNMQPEDEPSVRNYLADRWETMKKVWGGIS